MWYRLNQTVVFSVFCFAIMSAEARQFTNTKGVAIEATLIEVGIGDVKIKTTDGSIHLVKIHELSQDDQKYIEASREKFRKKTSKPFAAIPYASIKEASQRIDELVSQSYRRNKVEPHPMVDDARFLRRTYLSIAGRIPTYTEVIAFNESGSQDKRAELIDQLLQSDAYVSHQYNYWADKLRVHNGKNAGNYYELWLKHALRDNMPYDVFVSKLITAKGYPVDNGAVGFYMRDEGMPLDHLASASQVFLGTQLVCAQCHNHPFDKWTQKQYYQLTAFTYGIDETKRVYPSNYQASKRLIAKDDPDRSKVEYALKELYYVNGNRGFQKTVERKRSIKLPSNYQYDDTRPNAKVEPKPIFGELISKSDSHTEQFAQWMTSKENERFSKTIANYMWNKVMGYGLFNPVDELKDDTVISNPELMDYLESMMKSLDFDLKQFLRVIYNTELYHRESSLADINLEKPYHFPGPIMMRMSAEQFWDSLITLTIPEPDKRVYRTRQIYAERQTEIVKMDHIAKLSPQEVLAIAEQVVKARNDAEKGIRDLDKKIQQALKKNNTTTLNRLRYEQAVLRDKRNKKIGKITGENSGAMMDDMAMMGMSSMMEAGVGKDVNNKLTDAWESFKPDYVRASELRSPAPPGHFLQQFGQSNREIIGNSSREPSVSQVLTLLNGPHFSEMMKPESVLSQNLAKVGSTDRRMKVVFLSILNREPTKTEIVLFKKEARRKAEKPVKGVPEQKERGKKAMGKGYSNVIWALLNTRQFQYVE